MSTNPDQVLIAAKRLNGNGKNLEDCSGSFFPQDKFLYAFACQQSKQLLHRGIPDSVHILLNLSWVGIVYRHYQPEHIP